MRGFGRVQGWVVGGQGGADMVIDTSAPRSGLLGHAEVMSVIRYMHTEIG